MKRYINFKNIASLIFSINFLLGIEQTAIGTNTNSSKKNSNVQEIIQQSDKNNQNQKLINAFNSLKDSIKSFNSKLPSAVNNPSQQKEVNSQDVISKVEKFRKELSIIKQTDTVKRVIAITNEINTIIESLKDGLQPDGVSQVQKKLDFFVREGISKKSYGKFGETTQQEIEKFLNQNIDELEKKVNQIKIEPKDIAKRGDNLPPVKNNDKTKELESQILELKNDIRKTSAIVYILLFIILVGMGVYGYKFYLFLNKSNTNSLNKTTAVDQDDREKLINSEHLKIEVINEVYKDLNKVLHDFNTRIQKLEAIYQNLSNQTYPSTNVNTNQPITQSREVSYLNNSNLYSQSNISNSHSKLLSAYNLNSRSLSQSATTVSESEYTAEQRRLGRSVPPILESNNRGNYWILTEGNNEYLFPKGGLKISKHNYHTIAAFFECLDYQPGTSNNFTVLKPAKVSSIGEQWELRETGQLNFYQ